MANLLRRREGGVGGLGLGLRDPIEMMRELAGWDPFAEMAPLVSAREAFIPGFDVKETKDSYVFKADLPGVREEDVDISLTGNRLTISGKREAEKHEEGDTWYAAERTYGVFTRAFTLPEGVDADHISAELKNGVLNVVLPKKPELTPRKISVGGGGGKTVVHRA